MNQTQQAGSPHGGQRPAAPPTLFRRINDAVARGEAAVATGMLLLMLVVAFAQAFLRNLTQEGIGWANSALMWLHWGDFVLQKGTLWLAFLGASLAVHSDKHVAIDLVPRFASGRGRLFMRGLVGFCGAAICFFLARAFFQAILVNGAETEADVMLLTGDGSVHLCDASDAVLNENQASRGVFCLVRGLLGVFGVPMQTPGAAFQLIVPVMLTVMSIRALANGINEFMRFSRGESDDDPSAHGLVGASHDVADDIAKHGGHQ
jgi:TRAP-type C4-dicarboxylate transport system permease small subunit